MSEEEIYHFHPIYHDPTRLNAKEKAWAKKESDKISEEIIEELGKSWISYLKGRKGSCNG